MAEISVIVPIYKVEAYIHRCVDSILNQTFQNIEIILVEDGSPDNCGEICDEYQKKDQRVIAIHKKNEGLAATRDYGAKYVSNSCKYLNDVHHNRLFLQLQIYLYTTSKRHRLFG